MTGQGAKGKETKQARARPAMIRVPAESGRNHYSEYHMRTALFRGMALGLALVTAQAPLAIAQESHRVQFAKGNDNAYVEGVVVGDTYVDYILGARAGQTMGVSLITEGNAYFNILPPGSSGEAIYIGSINGPDAIGVKLPANGDYRIRVYLMGNAADTGARVPFGLSMTIM